MHEVDVPLAHVPDHTWLGMSEEEWAVNLGMYATQPERFLQLQCEASAGVIRLTRKLTAGPATAADRLPVRSRHVRLTSVLRVGWLSRDRRRR